MRLTSQDVEKYNLLLAERVNAVRSIQQLWKHEQTTLPSDARDATIAAADVHTATIARIDEELKRDGIVDKYGSLTPKAIEAGVKQPYTYRL